MTSPRLAAVAQELLSALAEADLPTEYAELVKLGVALEGKLLSPNPTSRWPMLTLSACETVGGSWESAVPAAAAVELFVAALDLLDDLEDEDDNPVITACGPARALNVATGMLMLAQRLLLFSTRRGIGPATVLGLSDDLSQSALRVGGGQHLDLRDGDAWTATEEDALEIASRKSATLTACACRLGARVGGADADIVEALGRFGWNLGLAAQLWNDLGDAAPGHPIKSDIRRGKRTLPLVVARQFDSSLRERKHSDGPQPDGGLEDVESVRRRLADSGALHYTWVRAEMHRASALEILDHLDPKFDTSSLRALV